MPPFEIAALILAGIGAATVNTIVGSGSLITFPLLLFFGIPAVVANMTNTIGLVPGGLSGVYGYRRELAGKGALLRLLVPFSFAGAATGAVLLLVLPPKVFEFVVPALIGVGMLLVMLGPRLQRAARARQQERVSRARRALLPVGVYLASVYGGYFSAAQGVIVVGLLEILTTEDLQTVNALKNVLALVVNVVAAAMFVVLRGAEVNWPVAAILGVGTLAGGLLGARLGRALPPVVLRGVIVAISLIAIARLTVWT